ncbi:MAG: 4-(cytidine 5'-diphospho)-2-C-methyl-D-erythritol kinase [Firmicutes bacterium]|nr:4-(cytidine 5'-diphospho)-2-C-methyl-D-erythritol kinase [Candidatus Fermentithermobacillaceae bacterium]
MAPREIRVRARGKINLGLGILGKRPDGYHEVESVAVLVGLADDVAVRAVPHGIEVRCPGVPGPPEENLAFKAGQAVLQRFRAPFGLHISISKRLPVGGGMGGASADAAAVLKAAWMLLGEPAPRETLTEIACTLGADVPMFLPEDVTQEGQVAAFLLRGRGDEVVAVRSPELPEIYFVLVLMNFPVSTAWAYARWDEMFARRHPADGRTTNFADSRIPLIVEALKTGDARILGSSVFNDLEKPVATDFPLIHEVKRVLRQAGALGAVMTGSGSTVAGIVIDPSHGLRVCREFRRIWAGERAQRLEKSSSLPVRPGIKELVLVGRSRVLGRCAVS